MKKIVAQLNDDGYLVGPVWADESPLEPGVFLIPDGAVDRALPDVVEPGKRYRPWGAGWRAEALPVEQPGPELEPTEEDIIAARTAEVQAHMDDAARGFGYDSIYTAATYAEEPAVPKFQAEGRAFRAWRSRVWARCHEVMADVKAGKRPMPSREELIEELPALVLPA